MTYNRMKAQIVKGVYTREEALSMMDVFLMARRITVDQYTELAAMLPAETTTEA